MRHLKNSIYNDSVAFATVVETKSFSLAARKLLVDQSTISRRIANLEKELGTELLIRNTRHITVSEEGMSFYNSFVTQEQFMSSIIDNFKMKRRLTSSKIRLSLPIHPAVSYVVPKLVEYLHQAHHLTLEIIYQSREIDPIKEPHDIVILRHIPKNKQFIVKEIFAGPIHGQVHLYCTQGYIDRYGKPNSIDDIGQSHIVIGKMLDNFNPINEITLMDKSGEIIVINNPARCYTNSLVMDDILLKNHQAISVGWDNYFKEELAKGSIKKILPQYRIITNIKLYLVYNKKIMEYDIMKKMIALIEEQFALYSNSQ